MANRLEMSDDFEGPEGMVELHFTGTEVRVSNCHGHVLLSFDDVREIYKRLDGFVAAIDAYEDKT